MTHMQKLLGGFLLIGSLFVHGASIYVSPTGDENNVGSAESPKRNIQAALNKMSNPGGEVVLLPGTYALQSMIVGSESGALHSNKNGSLRSSTGNPADVIIDAGGQSECLRVAGSMKVSGISFTNGKKPAGSASTSSADMVSVQSATCVISNCAFFASATNSTLPTLGVLSGSRIIACTFSSITGRVAGAVADLGGTGTEFISCRIENCFVAPDEKTSPRLGAVRARAGCLVKDCTFINNYGLSLKPLSTAENPVRVEGCLFESNYGGLGGACEMSEGTQIKGCTFRANRCGSAGGALISFGGFITNTVFEGNVSHTFGGAIACAATNTPLKIVDTRFFSNVATNSGGALSLGFVYGINWQTNTTTIYNGCIDLSHSVLSNNTAYGHAGLAGNAYYGGGAIWIRGKQMDDAKRPAASGGTISHCTFVENTTPLYGGALEVRNFGGTSNFEVSYPLTIRNCLFARNRAKEGGGLYIIHNGKPQDYLVASCTIVDNMADGDSHGHGLYDKHVAGTGGLVCTNTLFGDTMVTDKGEKYAYCLFDPRQGTPGSGAQAMIGTSPSSKQADPKFVNASAGNYRISSSRSPAYNAGLEEPWMTESVDLDGKVRIFKRIPDIGCYEYSFPLGTLVIIQ